jgi:hypothetical protein
LLNLKSGKSGTDSPAALPSQALTRFLPDCAHPGDLHTSEKVLFRG